jgi:rare lipoprotein A (peptidoglycan hydrolase)
MSPLLRTTTFLRALAASAVLALACSGVASAASAGGASAPAPEGTGTTTAPATPAPSTHRIHSTGIATWFGPGFYGHETACGQTLTPTVVGVANRTLPCGTLIRVTYAGRAITVPVLDRGPYSHIGASWDLTAGAAEALGITETVRIGTRIVGATANTPSLGLPAGIEGAAGATAQPTATTATALAGGALAG